MATEKERLKKWSGFRQDSGDPMQYAPKVQEVYKAAGIEHRGKIIVYSDGLNVEKCVKLHEHCVEFGFKRKYRSLPSSILS